MDHSIFYGFFTTLLGGDETAGVELFDWMKGLLVTPEIKPHKAIALVGPPGCGKHAVAELLRRMLGGGAVLEEGGGWKVEGGRSYLYISGI